MMNIESLLQQAATVVLGRDKRSREELYYDGLCNDTSTAAPGCAREVQQGKTLNECSSYLLLHWAAVYSTGETQSAFMAAAEVVRGDSIAIMGALAPSFGKV